MRSLYFHAVAGHANVAAALESQARSILHPFDRFLRQSIETAKQRQVRYQLPWKPARDSSPIRVDPIDSILRVPRQRPQAILTDWPADRQPDTTRHGFVLARDVLLKFLSATCTPDGLAVETEPALEPADEVMWCGLKSAVRVSTRHAPRKITDEHGRDVPLIVTPQATDDGQSWDLTVEGRLKDCRLVLDGEDVDARVVPASEDRIRVFDCNKRSFDVIKGTLQRDGSDGELPAEGLLRDQNGLRYQWKKDRRHRGVWVQLLPPDSSADSDEFLDPRSEFCDGNAHEVWTQPHRREGSVFSVLKTDQDNYQILLDPCPPAGSTLFLPTDLRNLKLQRRAIRQLREAPLPHHQGLLRLCEDPKKVRWPDVSPVDIREQEWRALIDSSRDGTIEQRAFVSKALGSRDFAFLEGPPGSGKTTAICEIIHQLVLKGKRVLLCASTHVAIDNVLESMCDDDSHVYAVRIGRVEKVDDRVQRTQLDERVKTLVATWKTRKEMGGYGDSELEAMAERTVVMAANLTCGTTMGIANHPLFRQRNEDQDGKNQRSWESSITSMPHWDVLIVDEASKTLIQEFLVPAMMAKRWIIVGDVRQLPPFTDRADLEANIRNIVDENKKEVFPPAHQRACLLLFRMRRKELRERGLRWLFVEPPEVLDWIEREVDKKSLHDITIARISTRKRLTEGTVRRVSLDQLRYGTPEALHVVASDWVLVDHDAIEDAAPYLPSNLLITKDLTADRLLSEDNSLFLRQSWWLRKRQRLTHSYHDRDFQYRTKSDGVETYADAQDCEQGWLQRHNFAQEITWRTTRLHELRRSRNERKRDPLRDEIEQLTPACANIKDSLEEIEDIGLPSILEVIQEGIGKERAKRVSSLTVGMGKARRREFDQRFERLRYQHRMHPDIASFPRDVIYQGQALQDANTIESRDLHVRWDFHPFDESCPRRLWVDVVGREQNGVNVDEIEAMKRILYRFISWAKKKGPPARKSPPVWQVACLCFYVKQELALSDMLREVTKDNRKTRFEVPDVHIELRCGTVDRFQGREADLVLLSMRNTRRVGFLDSPNRLNVAVTRARQQLVVFGNADYFGKRCRVAELQELVTKTYVIGDNQRRIDRGYR